MGVFSYSDMKLLLLLVAAAGVAQGAVTCDECQAAAQDFVSHLLTEESLAEQVQLMKDNVCPQLGVDGCEGILDMWYADMATCIFNHFILEGDGWSLLRKDRYGEDEGLDLRGVHDADVRPG